MQRIPCGQTKVKATINELKQMNIIKVFRGKSQNNTWDTNSYEIDLKYLLEYISVGRDTTNSTSLYDQPIGHDTPKGYVLYDRGVGCNTTKKNTNKNTKENTNKNIYAQQAEQLWSSYPNKKGKDKAIKKLPKLIHQYGYEQLERCIDRYVQDIEAKQTSKEYIKHGSTFFNGGFIDYLDENYQEAHKEELKEVINGGEPKPTIDPSKFYSDEYVNNLPY
ncbi:hypothetical protein [Cellulosilyticum lentocellum]|nr:hypothetical protein [Cellulosilyticum lentocellum]